MGTARRLISILIICFCLALSRINATTLEYSTSQKVNGTITGYDNVTVDPGVTLTISDWNGANNGTFKIQVNTGGVIEIRGNIYGVGAGYRGGAGATGDGADSTQGESSKGTGSTGTSANAEGGGACWNPESSADECTGGGGGLGGAGGAGKQSSNAYAQAGSGGSTNCSVADYSYCMGGGAGGSVGVEQYDTGTDGGGAIYLNAPGGTVYVTGILNVSGTDGGTEDLGGGGGDCGAASGGSGGTILINATTIVVTGSTMIAKGGNGKNWTNAGDYVVAGSGGGGGYIKLFYQTLTGNSSANYTLTGGSAGDSSGTCLGWCIDGNAGSSGVLNTTQAYTGDTTPPTISISIPVNNTNYTWASGGNQLNITFGETISWGSYSVDGAANVSTGAVAELNTTIKIAAGSHNLTVYANDSSGNLNSTFRQFNISTVQLYASVISNGTYATSKTYYRGQDFNFTGRCSDSSYSTTIKNNVTGNTQSASGTGSASILGSYNNSVYPTYDFIWNATCSGDVNHTAASTNTTSLTFDPGIGFYVNSSLGSNLYWSFDSTTFSMDEPVNQTSAVPSLCVNNTRAGMTYNVSVILGSNTSALYNVTVWVNWVYNSTNSTEVTHQTDVWIFNNTAANAPKCFWIWANASRDAPYGTWTPDIYADTKVS